MSEQDRRIAEHIAQTVVARLMDAVQSEETADRVLSVWGGKLDRTIGRGLRRLGFYVLVIVIGIASIKIGLWEKVAGFFKVI